MSTSTPRPAREYARSSIVRSCGARDESQAESSARADALVRSVEGDLRRLARNVARGTWVLDVDDLMQRGLEVAYARAPLFDEARGVSFAAFINQRARGAMLDACRAAGRVARRFVVRDVDVDELGHADGQGPSVASVEDTLVELEESEARRERVALVLGKLSRKERALVEACAMGGASVAEAATAMGIGYQAAWERYDVARKKIRRALSATLRL